MADKKVLAINPGSTSTKIAVFFNTRVLFLKSIWHPVEDLEKFKHISDQFEYRKHIILQELKDAHIDLSKIEAVVGRGGLVKPIKSGVYCINDALKKDLREGVMGEHASNLGGLIADDIAKALPNAKAYIADPVVVDELDDVARLTGHPEFVRQSIFHALNHKSTARAYARLLDKNYEDLNLIIAHMGGGISVGAHSKGRVIDVNQALDGDGPFSPERTGTLPARDLVRMCFSNKYTEDEILDFIKRKGGLISYFGTNSTYEVEMMVRDGNKKAKLVLNAMSYQIGKEIGAMAAVLKGDIDGIILTGGISHIAMIVEYIKKMVSFIAPVIIYPGEDEMYALAMNGLMVLRGDIEPKEYDESNMVKGLQFD
ncbi:MAG: butyrate kinase [Bacteroidales bacterium]|nr:butyrate kinase [Bacteroidales bacterium]